MKKINKVIFVLAVMAMVLSMAPIGLKAAVPPTQSLIKTNTSSAVYYLDGSGNKHPFYNEDVYFTWYDDWSGVKIISQEEMNGYTLGSPVWVRGGTALVQFGEQRRDGSFDVSGNPQVYAVSPGGRLIKIASADVAIKFYGANWQDNIIQLPVYLYSTYTPYGSLDINSNYPTGTLIQIPRSDKIYYLNANVKRHLTPDGQRLNHLNFRYLLHMNVPSNYTEGAEIVGQEAEIKYIYHQQFNYSGCYISGCNGEICSDNLNFSTNCNWQQVFSCYREAVCERQQGGSCGWRQTESLKQCVLYYSGSLPQ